jgi:putative transposase
MPTHRISPAEQMRQSVEQFLSGGMTSEEEPTSTLVRLAARVVLQEALEAEQRDVVGRDRYERGSDGRYRNGYRPGHVDSAEGRIDVQVPQVRGVPGHHSKLLEFLSPYARGFMRSVTA